tara:strand:- start:544 stop:1200 length:657 start_codon:yes stop_codon:yes gene_type:complete
MGKSKVDMLDMFSIPLIHCELDEDTSELRQCTDYVLNTNQVDVDEYKIFQKSGLKETIDFEFRVLEQFPKMKQMFTHISNRLVKEGLNYDNKLEISSSWFTKTHKGESSPMHDHKNCVFSAVYYYGDYDDKVGNLIFKNPIVNLTSYRLNVGKSNKFNTYDIEITPQAGSLLIFPSYVSHKIDVHKSDIPRLSLAFNMIPVGQYGIGDSQADTSWISK